MKNSKLNISKKTVSNFSSVTSFKEINKTQFNTTIIVSVTI